jgi:hypothetical protein
VKGAGPSNSSKTPRQDAVTGLAAKWAATVSLVVLSIVEDPLSPYQRDAVESLIERRGWAARRSRVPVLRSDDNM